MNAFIDFDIRLTANQKRKVWRFLFVGLLVHYALTALFPLTNDESYYWDWSSALQWSYLDHPPMVGWLAALIRLTLGDLAYQASTLPRVLSPILHLLATLYLLRTVCLWSRLEALYPNIIRCLWAAILFPGFTALGATLLPDTPLLLALAVATYYVVYTIQKESLDTPEALAIGASLGCAGLSKYHAVIVGLGLISALTILLIRKKSFTVAPFVLLFITGLATISPVLIWNATHDFASFRFQSNHGFGGLNWQPLSFLRTQFGLLFLLSPVGYICAYRLIFSRKLRQDRFEYSASGKQAIVWSLTLGFGLFLLVSCFKPVLPHWFLPFAWIAIPLGASSFPYTQSIWQKLNILPLIIGISIVAAARIAPHAALQVSGSQSSYRTEIAIWPPLAAEICDHRLFNEAKQANSVHPHCADLPPVVTFRWFWAAQLSWHMHNKAQVYNFDKIHPSYYTYRDFPERVSRLAGCTVVLVGDRRHWDESLYTASNLQGEPSMRILIQEDLMIPGFETLPIFIGLGVMN